MMRKRGAGKEQGIERFCPPFCLPSFLVELFVDSNDPRVFLLGETTTCTAPDVLKA